MAGTFTLLGMRNELAQWVEENWGTVTDTGMAYGDSPVAELVVELPGGERYEIRLEKLED